MPLKAGASQAPAEIITVGISTGAVTCVSGMQGPAAAGVRSTAPRNDATPQGNGGVTPRG